MVLFNLTLTSVSVLNLFNKYIVLFFFVLQKRTLDVVSYLAVQLHIEIILA